MSSMGAHLYESYDANQPYPAPTPYPFARYPFEPYHGRVDYLDFAGGSTYYGGQLKLSGQPLPGLHFDGDLLVRQVHRRFHRAGNGSGQPSSGSAVYLFLALRAFRFSVRYSAEADAGRIVRIAISCAACGTLITIQSGLPFTPQLAVNSLNNGGFQLPNRVGNGTLPRASNLICSGSTPA